MHKGSGNGAVTQGRSRFETFTKVNPYLSQRQNGKSKQTLSTKYGKLKQMEKKKNMLVLTYHILGSRFVSTYHFSGSMYVKTHYFLETRFVSTNHFLGTTSTRKCDKNPDLKEKKTKTKNQHTFLAH